MSVGQSFDLPIAGQSFAASVTGGGTSPQHTTRPFAAETAHAYASAAATHRNGAPAALGAERAVALVKEGDLAPHPASVPSSTEMESPLAGPRWMNTDGGRSGGGVSTVGSANSPPADQQRTLRQGSRAIMHVTL